MNKPTSTPAKAASKAAPKAKDLKPKKQAKGGGNNLKQIGLARG